MMVSHADKWIRIYDIPETSTHRKGFTIYKVISMLYPEKCPDAVTKITVWKRYNEFKKLHRELKSKHKSLRLTTKFPLLPSHPFFKRFNEDIIKERQATILFFLEYIGKQPELFASDTFVKFFEISHTPTNLLNSSINSIRADLHLPSEPEFFSVPSISSDDEYTLSDTDSVSTLSSLSPSVQAVDLMNDPLRKSTTSLSKLSKRVSSDSLATVSEYNDFATTASSLLTPPKQESASNIITGFPKEYIVEAAHFITKATELELDKNYEEAFSAYKRGIDTLLTNVKYDKNIERREQVRFKVERYLLRAEKIYNLYLSPEIKQINELTTSEIETSIQKPLEDLFKYKAIKIIGSGMLVIHSETQELYFIKVIHKTWKYSSDYLILPDNVPYMIKLHNYYDCENAVFLILQYCCGLKLLDYIKNLSISNQTLKAKSYKDKDVASDNESEGSYSDLINEYAANKQLSLKTNDIQKDLLPENIIATSEDRNDDCIVENGLNNLEIDDVLTKSQKLISSIEEVLNTRAEEFKLPSNGSESKCIENTVERKLSNRSLLDDLEFPQTNINIEDVVKWAAQLLLALEKLHVLGVVCGDLNLNNLLIDDNSDLVLTYMCSLSEDKLFKNNNDLSLAPELYSFEKITYAVDWWSYGTILYELLVGLPLKSIHPEGITTYTSLKIPKHVSPEGRSLLKQLLVHDSTKRLGCGANGTEDIKTHPFFHTICWEHLASKYVYIV